MNAKLVWDTWRRILSDDNLVEQVLNPDQVLTIGSTQLTADEVEILADYASTRVATDTNIAMYRQGLVRNALASLTLVPLTRHLFYMSGLDTDATASEFSRSTNYFDYGPNSWRNAGCFVRYLAGLAEFSAPEMRDVLELDLATIALAQNLGRLAPAIWPQAAASSLLDLGLDDESESVYLVANRAGTVASSSYDLTEWLENSDDFDVNTKLEPSKRHWMIYFASENAGPEYAELSGRAARVFDLLAVPKTVAELSCILSDLSIDKIMLVIAPLTEMGLIVRIGDNASLQTMNGQSEKRPDEKSTIVDRLYPAVTPTL